MNRDKVKCYIYTRVSTAIQVDGYALESGVLVIAENYYRIKESEKKSG